MGPRRPAPPPPREEEEDDSDQRSVLDSVLPPAQQVDADGAVMAVAGQHVADFKKQVPWALIVFLIFAPIFALLRFSGYFLETALLPGTALDAIHEYGPYLLILIHVIIVIMAFGDAVVDGILCLLVPLYSFYFVLASSDRAMLRVVLLILLIFVGYDTVIFAQVHGLEIYTSIDGWIKSGGGA